MREVAVNSPENALSQGHQSPAVAHSNAQQHSALGDAHSHSAHPAGMGLLQGACHARLSVRCMGWDDSLKVSFPLGMLVAASRPESQHSAGTELGDAVCIVNGSCRRAPGPAGV